MFNETLNGDDFGTYVVTYGNQIEQDVTAKNNQISFTSNGNNYTYLCYADGRIIPTGLLVYSRETWDDQAYRTITITDTSSLTNRGEFTTWLKTNATKQ